MSQSFDLSGVTTITHNGADVSKLMLDNVRIWERYQTTQQVWVSSGYYQTAWVHIATHADNNVFWYWNGNHGYGWWAIRGYGIDIHLVVGGSPRYQNGYKFVTGSSWWSSSNGFYKARVHVYNQQNQWVDTSHWESQTVTAYYY